MSVGHQTNEEKELENRLEDVFSKILDESWDSVKMSKLQFSRKIRSAAKRKLYPFHIRYGRY